MKKWIAALALLLLLPALALGENVENKLGTQLILPSTKGESAPEEPSGIGSENRLGAPLQLPSMKGDSTPAPDKEKPKPPEAQPGPLANEQVGLANEQPERNAPTRAEDIDLSGLNVEELAELRDRINLAMHQSAEWQEVTVPQGVWIVGEDIPAGHWTITAANGRAAMIDYGSKLDPNGKEVSYASDVYYIETLLDPSRMDDGYDMWAAPQTDLDMKDGMYFVVSGGSVIFTPYAGKPALDFKW